MKERNLRFLHHFGGYALTASNSSVDTLDIFASRRAFENACWGASPNPAFGTSCPKVLLAAS